ncbi:hypothetical protein [Variovorax sp. AFSI2.2]|uniref:hypothetical protein n=1 Tax=Variovorax sp. AFSI2.2 TaxID=3384160 RepID=UPI003EB7575A
MLVDRHRCIAAPAKLNLGQPAHFVDFHDCQARRGKIIAMRGMQATALEEGIPWLALQGYHRAEQHDEQASYEPPPGPARAITHTRELQRGGTVTFTTEIVTTGVT